MSTRLMEVLPIDIFGLQLDIPFASPRGLSTAALESFSARLCHPGEGLGLRPDQLRLKRWDDLFGYELSAQFFADNGTLTRTADRTKIGIRNGRTAGDWAIIRNTVTRFLAILSPAPETATALAVHAHARFPSVEERDEWLEGFSYSPLIARAAALGHVRIPDWEEEIRVMIERSNVLPDAVFILWETQFKNDQEWETFLGSVITMMENAVNLFDLGFEPLREGV